MSFPSFFPNNNNYTPSVLPVPQSIASPTSIWNTFPCIMTSQLQSSCISVIPVRVVPLQNSFPALQQQPLHSSTSSIHVASMSSLSTHNTTSSFAAKATNALTGQLQSSNIPAINIPAHPVRVFAVQHFSSSSQQQPLHSSTSSIHVASMSSISTQQNTSSLTANAKPTAPKEKKTVYDWMALERIVTQQNLTDVEKKTLIAELEKSPDPDCQELLVKAKKIKFYATRSLYNIARVINIKIVSLKIESFPHVLDTTHLRDLHSRPMTKNQAKTIIRLLHDSAGANEFAARCYNRFEVIKKYWEQLESSSANAQQMSSLPENKILSLALTLENACIRATEKNTPVVDLVPYYIFGRSALIHYKNRKFYIVSKKIANWKNYAGSEKVCRTALELDFDNLSYMGRVAVKKTRVEAPLAYVIREFQYQQKLQLLPNVEGIDFSAKFISRQQKTGKEFEQIFAVSQLHQTSLWSIMHLEQLHKLSVSPSEKLHIASDILNGIDALHAHRILHRDLKAPNVLLDTDNQGHYTATVCDFGMILQFGERYDMPMYGSTFATDPTLIANAPVYKNDFTKLDMFAFGIIVYMMLNLKLPPWSDELEKIENLLEITPLDKTKINSLLTSAAAKINAYRNYLKNKLPISYDESKNHYVMARNLSATEVLEFLTYLELNPAPSQRFSASRALKLIQRCQTPPAAPSVSSSSSSSSETSPASSTTISPPTHDS